MPNHTSDTGTDDEYGQRYPQRTRKNSYKKSTGKNISSETRVNERKDDGKKTRHKEYDTNREINNMSTISEKSIIETITQNNITTKLLNIFGWNKQPQNYNEQFRFQYQQLQNQFNNQYQLMHNQYQSLLQQQVHNQQMKTQKTTNQDLTQHLINPHRNINNQNQYTNTNTVRPQTSQTQNTHNRVNSNDQHKSFIDHIVTTIETSNRVLNVTIVRPDPLNQSDHLPEWEIFRF